MPPKKKEKKKQPTAEDRTAGVSNTRRNEPKSAMRSTRPKSSWKSGDGNKNDNGIQAAFRALEVYTRGYIEAQKTY